jgi:hypothetical protein
LGQLSTPTTTATGARLAAMQARTKLQTSSNCWPNGRVFVLMIGCGISLWPEVRFRELGVWSYVRATAGVATGIAVSIMIASSPARASAMVDPAGEMVRAPTRGAAASPFHWDESRAASGLGALGAGVSLGALALAIAGRRRRKSDV